MIRILLVDDEPIEREGLRKILEKNRSNAAIITEARNGEEAIKLALEYKPDLIFMDIKMPETDGVKAVKEILHALPDTKCIMVTAFDTFRYAQEVMKYGIKEYLLKPSKKSHILEAFDRMVFEIEEDRKIAEEKTKQLERLERSSSLVKSNVIVSLMMDYRIDIDGWDEWFELEGKKGVVVVFSFEGTGPLPSSEKVEEAYHHLKETIHDEEEDEKWLFGPLIRYHVPVIKFFEQEDSFSYTLEEDIRRIIHTFQNKGKNLRLVAGAGSVVNEIHQFSQSYGEATAALEYVYHQHNSSYMIYDEKLKEKRKELLPFEMEKELLEAVKQGDVKTGLHCFDKYFQMICEVCGYQLPIVKKSMEEFFIVLKRKMREFGIEEEIHHPFHQMETSMQMKESSKILLSSVIEKVHVWRQNDMKGVLAKAKEYIDLRYHEQVSLEEVAREVGLSFYYLSKLFKERYNCTFSEYLTQVRIAHAKEYLEDQHLPLKEIAIDIGYKDPNYFSRVFKKQVGLSPTEYRNQI